MKTRLPLPLYAREIIAALVRQYGDLPDDMSCSERQWHNIIFVLIFAAARLIQQTANPAANCQRFIEFLQTATKVEPEPGKGKLN